MKQKTNGSDNFQDLCKTIIHLDDKKDAESFLKDLCTPAELEALSDRWAVARMVNNGVPYREITDKTGVSSATVTRVARFLNQELIKRINS
jgi:TrpR-related protein YerC/YecD